MAFHCSVNLRIRSSALQPSSFIGNSPINLRFPSCQLSIKARRRNCSDIGVAQIFAARWSNNPGSGLASAPAASSLNEEVLVDEEVKEIVELEEDLKLSFLKSDGSLTIHAGERLGRGIVTDAITTPIVNTTGFVFKKTADVLDFKVTV
ncbi:PREDICTED: cystathionine gamma-synthase 1, chloroplastic-like [Camelina sativa]|uniref:Cystathionine gamma-synthase 1, chloroplastic-like n=1 Tax=Camelina sativa TaxID=90675 RepID=A0ABM1QBQ2_CAMSA|nr:PREDICTED: cystathionine gamma-synthase 1, chloroplastic-like [Camelina sativa]